MSTASDDDLLRQVAEGDEQALARLVTRHAPRLRAVALRFTGSGADADEIVQDVFLAVWNNARRFDAARSRFSTWVYRIAANRCLDLLRRRRWSWLGLDAAEEEPEPTVPADRVLEDRQALAAVQRDILALPERQRLALLLVVTADFSADDVAEALRISRGAAEQLIVRARQSLRHRQRERGDT